MLGVQEMVGRGMVGSRPGWAGGGRGPRCGWVGDGGVIREVEGQGEGV